VTFRQGLAAIVSLVFMGVAFSAPRSGGALAPVWFYTAGLALLLEWRAVSLLGRSYFSAAPALYLALCCLGSQGARLALLAAIAGLALRTLQRGNVGSALADLLPVAAAAAFHPHPAFVLDAYVLAWLLAGVTLVPLEAVRTRQRLRVLSLCVVLFALAWRGLGAQGWLELLAATPVLWCLQFAAHRAVEGYRAEEREDLRAHLQRSWQEVEVEREQRAQLEQTLSAHVTDETWRQEAARELAGCRTLATWSERLFRLLRSVALLRSTALLEVSSDGQWVPIAQRSPDAAVLESSRLLGTCSPWLLSALASTQPVPAKEPILPEEPQALAFRLDERTVLYLGNPAYPAWTDQQRRLLALICRCAADGWSALQQVEQLQRKAGGAEALSHHVDLLEDLLRGAGTLAARLDAQQVVAQLLAAVQAFPGDSRVVYWWRDGAVQRAYGDVESADVASFVMESGKPLLLEDLNKSRFAALRPGERSLLAVPLQTEDSKVGAIVLGARELAAFQRAHQDRLLLLGMLAAQAVQNSQLHEQVVAALKSQRESEAQLIQSSKMAAVGQLAAGVAHELNTPLGTVVLGLDAFSRKAPDNPLLSNALDAARQAKEIVSKLLFYSRDARVGVRSADINAMVRDTLQLIGTQLRLDRVKVRHDLQPVPPVWVNQNELQQVITNLVLNARDAGGGWIEISTSVESQKVVLRVCDGGEGIAPEHAGRVFEPFFTTKPVGKGTGLGLSVSHQIVSSHGGELTLESLSNPTCFAVRLPLAAEGTPSNG
jgi:signal transduction histidine kinase